MAPQDGHQRKLGRLRQRLELWRAQHGGPGRALPEEFWREAVVIAGVLGVEPVVRALRVNRARLAGRIEDRARAGQGEKKAAQFVEVETRGLFAARTVVRLEAPDGERLELELGDSAGIDVVRLSEAFWSRPR